MPELRKDPIVEQWVIIATERGKRPSDFKVLPEPRANASCVFCAGHEHQTPPEVFFLPASDSRGDGVAWSVRVVPNKYPALHLDGFVAEQDRGLNKEVSGVGAHEVIIETPDHATDLAHLPAEEVASVMQTYRQRLRALEADDRLKYALIFKNQGRAAGASLEHAHSQLIATPLTPPLIKKELAATGTYYTKHKRCVYCDYLAQELADRSRLVAENERFVALVPYAARFPFEMWVLPRAHQHDFARLSDADALDLGTLLKDVLLRLGAALQNPPFNYVLHTVPYQRAQPGYWTTIERDYHWHLEITPRLSQTAGFELGSGLRINPTPPEVAAEVLRGALPPDVTA